MAKGAFRMTRSRRVILEEVARVSSHPTANDVFRAVRRRLPRVSLGTVYRNLGALASRGLLRELSEVRGQRRFDATCGEHCHVVCTRCGRVDDVRAKPPGALLGWVRNACDYEVQSYRLALVGLCPTCVGRRHGAAKSGRRKR
jgi:Fur family ferric uptake transcriptional regulator